MQKTANTDKVETNKPLKDYVAFQIKSNKNDLNLLINHYIQEEMGSSPIDYKVHLGNDVELYGKMPFFSETLDMNLTFEPKALKNGDLVLTQKSMSIGRLNLPVSYVLKFISSNYKLPRGVEIRPNDQMIYIHMQQLKLKSNMKIQVTKFDLKKDDISVLLQVPVK